MPLFSGSKYPFLGSCINLQVGMSSDVYTYIFSDMEIKNEMLGVPVWKFKEVDREPIEVKEIWY